MRRMKGLRDLSGLRSLRIVRNKTLKRLDSSEPLDSTLEEEIVIKPVRHCWILVKFYHMLRLPCAFGLEYCPTPVL